MTGRRAFVEGPFGQIHLRQSEPVQGRTPLVCLHATAYSSQSFLPLMTELQGERQLIAIDAPGYGDSDPPPKATDMAGYAAAVAAAIEAIIPHPVMLLGYHTGAYMAAELAIARPDLVDSLVLIGVPYFQALDVETWRRKLVVKHRLGGGLDQFAERWEYFVTRRDSRVSLGRAFANFVDELKAWPNGWWAHEAMFRWDSDARLPLVSRPVLILNPSGHLAEASRAAARLIPDCELVEMPDVDGPILETAPDRITAALRQWAVADRLTAVS